MKKTWLLLGLFAVLFFSGCVQPRAETKYVCPDRATIVSSIADCPQAPTAVLCDKETCNANDQTICIGSTKVVEDFECLKNVCTVNLDYFENSTECRGVSPEVVGQAEAIGTEITHGNVAVKVLSAKKVEKYEYSNYGIIETDTAPKGSAYVLVEAKITNLGSDRVSVTKNDFTLVDAESHAYQPQIYLGEKGIGTAKLFFNQTVQGHLKFMVPEGQDAFTVRYAFVPFETYGDWAFEASSS